MLFTPSTILMCSYSEDFGSKMVKIAYFQIHFKSTFPLNDLDNIFVNMLIRFIAVSCMKLLMQGVLNTFFRRFKQPANKLACLLFCCIIFCKKKMWSLVFSGVSHRTWGTDSCMKTSDKGKMVIFYLNPGLGGGNSSVSRDLAWGLKGCRFESFSDQIKYDVDK